MTTSRIGLGCAVFLGILAVGRVASATSGQNGGHDPSRLIPSNGKVFVYFTGGGGISSSDGQQFDRIASPPWSSTALPNHDCCVWAPDGIFLNGKFFLYYAYWRTSDKSSAVALLTNPSLDPTSPKFKWTDQGVAVAGPTGVTHSVIDPCPVLDAKGNLWVTWGGGYPFNSASNSIFVTRMDNNTGLPLTTDPGWKPPSQPGYAIETGHKEGSYLHYHGGYYYLFWQTGNGFDPGTSYTINMARASSITGPYSGDRVFYSKNPGPGIYGPGHMGIYNCKGVERFTYHFYSNDTNSGSALGENALSWGSDGWPVAGAVTSATFTPCSPEAGDNPNPDISVNTTAGGGGTSGDTSAASGSTDQDAGDASVGGGGGATGASADMTGGTGSSAGGSTTGTAASGDTSSTGSAATGDTTGSSGDTSDDSGAAPTGSTSGSATGATSGGTTSGSAASGANSEKGGGMGTDSGGGCSYTAKESGPTGALGGLAWLLGLAIRGRRRRA